MRLCVLKKMKVIKKATMSVYEGHENRTKGLPHPERASIYESLTLFSEMLVELQSKGVRPGTKLKVTIETLP